MIPEQGERAADDDDKRAVLDTTVQMDRVKSAARKEKLEGLLVNYKFTLAASFSLVEFKATVIQECITIHNQLRRNDARFTTARDALLEKNHPQSKLRAHIFNNYITVFAPSSFDITVEKDVDLALQARLLLENVIPRLYHWFSKSVGSVLKDKLRCDRSAEPPFKRTAAFSTNLPSCKRGLNKNCRVEELIREESVQIISDLQPFLGESEQLKKSVDVFRSVLEDSALELSVSDCRTAGDCLIAIEATGSATHALSSNVREWSPICEAVGFVFVHTTYLEEKTH